MTDSEATLPSVLVTPAEPAREAPVLQRRSSGRLALAQFALSSLALLVVVGTVGALALRRVATGEALHDARSVTSALSHGVIRDRINDGVLRGDPAALAELDRAVRARVLLGPIVRVKLWTTDGRIVYSDARALIGQEFRLPEDLREALADNAVRAEVSDLSQPENRFERSRGKLVEVYLPLTLADGRRVIVETYHRAGSIDSSSRRIWRSFLPVLLALLLVLAAAQLPLAWILARRVRADAQERERIARMADDALEAERRRIAAELHDGVVQDLAGMAFELQAAAERPAAAEVPAAGGDLPDVLRRSAAVCRNCMRALRTLLVDLYPSERREQGLGAAIDALAGPLRARGVQVSVEAPADGALPGDADELFYRAAQEALRNIDHHAAARKASVVVSASDDEVSLAVEDDGRGMTAAQLGEQHAAGHMGLALLAARVAARGGSLSIESEPGSGTRVRVTLPRT